MFILYKLFCVSTYDVLFEPDVATIYSFNVNFSQSKTHIICTIGTRKIHAHLFKCNTTYSEMCRVVPINTKVWIRWADRNNVILYKTHYDMHNDINRINDLINLNK